MDLAKYRRLFLEESREHLALLGRELPHQRHELRQLDAVELIAVHRHLPGRTELAFGVERNVAGFAPRQRQLVYVNIVHDREQPRPQVGSGPPQRPLLPRPPQRILHQVVGARRIAGQHARIAAQPWNRGDQVRVRQPGGGRSGRRQG